ncbi:2-amino-4-hydroxy-6-hydroxymethyldihydropteridine pyrophosphokinase [Rubripirellula lacrimiformis]|uniref:2-amino-4-hydroxy-6-hydroxymethyldihydropteridine pyrophosphokinase n=1 Tax=Rubripirellula lacrimiformis TaxID=1930273 RepID=A0A517NI87_9BACT|nr:2-amino-4-hydroxy-6-hydroxymethyldihydropteridine diphosphokinase [Rubripirellula lacrimiformis]QDT06841.1 2-amino-4-hydroxy-6-hydroxymethyldihydropteridine pyrophosphokinase [Rubripirellula lacrimiformis]
MTFPTSPASWSAESGDPSKSQCLISFGSNLGDRGHSIAEAARILADSPLTVNFAASRLFETPPIGGPEGQDPFLNAVAAFDTDATARQVLAFLQETENQLGRQRRQRWGARSIDLDVVLHGELIGGGTGLVVPHPRYTARQFVLQPACDVAPHYRDPRFGWTIQQLSDHLGQSAASLALVGGQDLIRRQLCMRVADEHGVTVFTDPDAGIDLGSDRTVPWISSFVPVLPRIGPALPGTPVGGDLDADPNAGRVSGRVLDPAVPRLVTRIQRSTPDTAWPAPHQMWPSGWAWPEYRLEVDDMDWAVSELVSALASMQCPIQPVTSDGAWWTELI